MVLQIHWMSDGLTSLVTVCWLVSTQYMDFKDQEPVLELWMSCQWDHVIENKLEDFC